MTKGVAKPLLIQQEICKIKSDFKSNIEIGVQRICSSWGLDLLQNSFFRNFKTFYLIIVAYFQNVIPNHSCLSFFGAWKFVCANVFHLRIRGTRKVPHQQSS